MSTQAVAKQAIKPANTTEERTMFRVLAAVSFCHVLNDMMQSLLPSIYPILKASFHLNFTDRLHHPHLPDHRVPPSASHRALH
jgi:FSR family fosmidomycin resistance protein-like MFS transporter